MKRERLLGAHVSIAGGVATAPARGGAIGATAIQIFTRNASQWKAAPLGPDDGNAFRAGCAEHGIAATAAHASYLINLAAPKPSLWKASLKALVEEIERCAHVGVPSLVVHPGAHVGRGDDEGIARIIDAVNSALDRTATSARRVSILLEGTAGQGTSIGWRFEHLAALLAGVADRGRAGVCLDTCHLFAAGYDLRDEAAVTRTLDEFDRVVGLREVRVVHVNDSRGDLGSRIDRHAGIGQGAIGEAGFRALMRDARLADCPFILETPKGDDIVKEDRRNLARLRRFVGSDS
ncbi:MAG: deoxyribonuclease IV [Planctomycetes bacterium]|nr:deoxyribonuclease IV [Planctomycetota bacterium]